MDPRRFVGALALTLSFQAYLSCRDRDITWAVLQATMALLCALAAVAGQPPGNNER